MDEIREQMDIANEINDAISQPLGGEMFDEVGVDTVKPRKQNESKGKTKRQQQQQHLPQKDVCLHHSRAG